MKVINHIKNEHISLIAENAQDGAELGCIWTEFRNLGHCVIINYGKTKKDLSLQLWIRKKPK